MGRHRTQNDEPGADRGRDGRRGGVGERLVERGGEHAQVGGRARARRVAVARPGRRAGRGTGRGRGPAGIRSPAPSTAPDGVVRSRAAAIGAPRVGVAERRVAARRRPRRRPRAASRTATGGRRSSASTSARYWSPRAATNDGWVTTTSPRSRSAGDQLDGDHRAVLDAVAGRGADVVPRGEGEDQLGARHAVHGDRPPGRRARAEPADELVERRQPGVVEDELHRPAGQADVGVGGNGGPPVTATASGKPSPPPRRRALERRPRSSVGVEVGDAGDAVGRPAPARRPPTSGGGAPMRRPQDVVEPVQAAGRPPVRRARRPRSSRSPSPVGRQRRGVEHPQRPAAVLHPHRPVGHERVEAVPVERAGDATRGSRSPRTHPVPWRRRRAGRRRSAAGIADVRWAEADRLPRRGHRQQVDVVVVQPGQHSPAGGVDDDVGAAPRRRRRAVTTPPAQRTSTHSPGDLGVADQQRGRTRPALRRAPGTSAIAAAISSSGSS